MRQLIYSRRCSFLKILKKSSAIIIAVALLFTVFSATASAKTLNYLLLGDSIAYGQGIVNSNDACYGRIVANTNKYNYYNDAISGINSSLFLELLQDSDVSAHIKKADIISISIGGNDFLTDNWIWMGVKGVLFNSYRDFDQTAADFAENLELIMKRIRSLNPGATILMQTVYNPHNDVFTPVFQEGVDRLNRVISDYLKANPGAYIIADVGGVISGHSEYIAIDTIHPNGQGNIAIAKYLLKLLKGLGLGTSTEPVIKVQPVDTTSSPSDLFNAYITSIVDFIARFIEIM